MHISGSVPALLAGKIRVCPGPAEGTDRPLGNPGRVPGTTVTDVRVSSSSADLTIGHFASVRTPATEGAETSYTTPRYRF